MNRKTGLVVVLALCSGFLFSAPPDSFEVTELYNVGHEVYSILVSPDDPGQIYVATNGSGILKSTNGGASWVSKNTGISDLRIYEMDFHPTNAAVLYAAAGKTSGGATDGFYRSTDSGESWQARKSGLPSNTYIFQLAVDQNNDQVLYAGTNGSGIYRTDNAGSSWTAVNSGVDAGTQIHAMLVHPTNSNIILAGSHDGKVYRSTNQGSSWTKVSIDNLSQWVLDIAFHTGSTGTWYIGTYGQGVLKSTDNGQTWQTMNTGLTDLKIYHLLYAHGMLLAGTEKKGLFCYTEGDGWVPWHSFTSVFSIDADPEDVTLFFIGTEDKIYRLHVIKSYGLDIQVNGSGSVSVNPEKADYSLNEEVEITAIPGSESTFSGWSGDANGSDNPLLLVMNSDKSITANFVSATHTLNIQVSGSGSATANPSKGSYTHNEQVEVTATPGSGHYFSGWGGDASGSDNPLLLVMDSDKSITAYFSQTQETVSDPSQPAGSATGKVGTSLSCTTGGSTSNIGSSVEYRFDWGDGSYSGWGGLSQSHIYTATGSYQVRAQARSQNNNSVVSGWSSSLTVAVSGYTLAVSISGSGSVVQDPQKDGYDQDESVQLTAQASTGSHFDRWGGDLSSTDNPVTVPMDGDKAVRAYFLPDETNGGNLISLQSPAGGESVEVGSDFGITWTSTGGIQTVDIILTRDGGSSYEYIAEGTENDGSYTWTATMWTSDNCLIQVYDTADQTVFDENATFFSITPQHLQGLTHPQAQPSGDAQNAYRLVSVPLELDDTRLSNAFLDDLGQPDDNRWRLFDWQGGQWEEYSGDQTIEPGRSFFLIVKDAGVQLDVGPGHLVMSESYSISLNAGWNSIANPYNFGLTDSELFPDSEEWVTLWAYNGGWDVTSDLVPWEGYGIYVESGGTLHVIPDWFGTGKAKARRKDFRILSEWFVQIEAACGSAVDAANYCGVYDEERGKQAMFRLHKPPAVGEFVHVYLKNADDPTSQFAADFRPAGRERLRWDLAAQTHIPNRPLSFRIKQSKNLPEGYAVILKDKDSGRCETLSPDGIPVFVSGAGPEAMEFELAIGDSKDLSEEETIPAAFQLEPCYPNPFNQTTVIPFSLAEACEVTLIVYNVHGEETCRLIQDKPYGEGLHKAVWSGLDASRQPAASGIYIYKLSTNTGFHAVSRMIFLK